MKRLCETTVRLTGGLENQLFLLSVGLSISKKNNGTLCLDISNYTKLNSRKYELDVIDHGAKVVNLGNTIFKWPISKFRHFFTHKIYRENSLKFDPNIFSIRGNTILEGYFQSWKYFDSNSHYIRSIIDSYKSKSVYFMNLMEQLQSQNPCIGVHVRRGDFLTKSTSDYHGLLPDKYFINAIDIINDKLDASTLLLSSDDEYFLRNNPFSKKLNLKIIDKEKLNHPLEAILLLSKCNGLVLSNSSFSWWSAWLSGENTTVIAPRPWYKQEEYIEDDLLMPNWHRLEIFT